MGVYGGRGRGRTGGRALRIGFIASRSSFHDDVMRSLTPESALFPLRPDRLKRTSLQSLISISNTVTMIHLLGIYSSIDSVHFTSHIYRNIFVDILKLGEKRIY